MKTRTTVSTWVRSTAVASLAALLGLVLSAGCSQVEGSRCNPALSHDECDNAPTVQCVQPMAAACNGEAYCCTVDSTGAITDKTDTNCLFLIACSGQGSTPSGDDGGGG